MLVPMSADEEARLRRATSTIRPRETWDAFTIDWRKLWDTLDAARAPKEEAFDRAVMSLCAPLLEAGKLMRDCLRARPPIGITDSARAVEWDASAALTLATTPEELEAESQLVERLIECVRAFRATTQGTEDEFTPAMHQRQLEAAGMLFATAESLDHARSRLYLWGCPQSSPVIPAGESHADPAATGAASKERLMADTCTRCMGPIENGRCLSCGAMQADAEDSTDGALDEQKEV